MESQQHSPGPPNKWPYNQAITPHQLLKQLLLVTAVALLVADLFFLLRRDFGHGYITLNLLYGTLLLLGAGLIKAGYTRAASHGFTAVLWLSLTLFLVVYGTLSTPGLGAYIIIVLVTALLLRGHIAFVYTLLSLMTGLLLAAATTVGRIPLYQPPTGSIVLIGNTFPKLLIILVILGLIFQALRFTLATLRFNEHNLDQIRQTLGQRTADLSATNEQLRHEIKERQQTEVALKQQRAFLRQIIDTIPHYVFVKDKNGRFLIINKALATAYHATPSEIEGHSGREFNPNNEEMTRFEEGDHAVLDANKEMIWLEMPFTDLDGRKHWLNVVKRPLYDQTQQEKHVLGIATDITLVKETTEALREKEENFRTLVEASFEGIIICVDHVIQQANANFATMFGYADITEVLGKNVTSFFAPETNDKSHQILSKHKKILFEAWGKRQNGSTFPLEIVSHPINYQGQQAQMSGYRDITTRKQAEEAEQHAQKLESLSIMAGGLAHDFNNLLVAMMSQIALAKTKIDPDHVSQQNLDKAIQATETTALLTRQLLAYTGQGHFEIKLLHLNELISQNLQLFQDALPQNITFHTQLHAPLPYIKADSAQIQQIIMNLLLNAAEAIGTKEGTITITTIPYHLTDSHIQKWQSMNEKIEPGNYVLLEVTDTGKGMDEAALSCIFDPFYSTKGTGRGLGLAAVLGIVRGHAGSLRTDSELGKGTSFQFLFPCEALTPVTNETAVTNSAPPRNTVLIVDDEKQVREALEDILDLEQIPSLTAANGQEGITLFTTHQKEIGLIILDLSMPGMSGIETFEALRTIEHEAKIILSSGYTEVEILEKLAGTRPTGFLQKPYRLKTVLETVEKHLS